MEVQSIFPEPKKKAHFPVHSLGKITLSICQGETWTNVGFHHGVDYFNAEVEDVKPMGDNYMWYYAPSPKIWTLTINKTLYRHVTQWKISHWK